MSIIKPFKAVRPTRDKVHLVASRSYITYNQDQLESKLRENPYSFIHILNPDFGKNKRDPESNKERFERIRNKFDEFVKDEILITDNKKAFYIYKQTTPYSSFTGIIACASNEDYTNDVIKKHEHTLSDRQDIFKEYLDVTNFNAEPVLMAYEDHDTVDEVMHRYMQTRPEYDFTTTDKNRHQVWIVDNPEHIERIENAFAEIPSIYIADGHHRSASSALLAQERNAKTNPEFNGSNYFLSYFVSYSQIDILPFHRLVRFKEGQSVEGLLEQLKSIATISPFTGENLPSNPHSFILVSKDETSYLVELNENIIENNSPLDLLPPEILSKHILTPLLSVKDLRTSSSVKFIGGRCDMNDIQKEIINTKCDIAFVLNPVSMKQLTAVADNNLFMPPKSTWVEPKLRSGLTFYEF